MIRLNAIHNCTNPSQGDAKKILCICSAGLLRSPTLAGELYKRGFNTRAAGVHDYALIPVDEVLIRWADVIIFVQTGLQYALKGLVTEGKPIIELEIPDIYEYRHPELVEIINAEIDKLIVNEQFS